MNRTIVLVTLSALLFSGAARAQDASTNGSPNPGPPRAVDALGS
jgi:hypothetical protein